MSLCSRLREVFHVFLMVIGNRVVDETRCRATVSNWKKRTEKEPG